ncbi:MAG TPA: hypothetical protein VF175_03685, partial [Lacipirellula sp.]
MFTNSFTSGRRLLLLALVAGLSAAGPKSYAAPATPIDTDVNADGLNFTGTDAFFFGNAFSQDTTASLNGNDFLVQTMYAQVN